MTNKIFFVHVMKTGGGAIRFFLQRNAKGNTFISHTMFETSFLSNVQMREIVSQHSIKYYCDHKLSFFSTITYNAKTFCIIRDPVDRFISFYNYINYKQNEFCSNDIMDAIHQTFVLHNVSPKTATQLHHISEFQGFSFVKHRVEKGNCLIIPYEYINDVPKILKINHELTKENTTDVKIVEKADDKIAKKIREYSEDDLYLRDWSTKYYEKHRDDILENWIKE